MGITQPRISDILRGDFTHLSERKLMDWLTQIGLNEDISSKHLKNPQVGTPDDGIP